MRAIITTILIHLLSLAICTSAKESPPPKVPENYLEKGAIDDPCSEKEDESRRYMIFWSAPLVEGQFVFVVHPGQILVRTIHDNPNPDFLYWAVKLEEKSYLEICKILDSYKGKFLSNEDVWKWGSYRVLRFVGARDEIKIPEGREITDEELEKAVDDHYTKLYANICMLVTWLNHEVEKNAPLIEYPPDDMAAKRRKVRIRRR